MVALSGSLRDKVTVLERTSTNTPAGPTEVWTPAYELWARVAIMSINTRAAYNQALKHDVTHTVTIRHAPAINLAGTRIRWRDEDYEVVQPATDPNGRREFAVAHIRKVDQ